jgi:putative spermidine/putrescine transport system substrate-binding protein
MRVFVALALALAAAAPAPAGDTPPALTVAIPPAAAAEPLLRLLLQPYADATGTHLATTGWDGVSLEGLRQPVPDLVLVTGEQLAAGCHAQVFAKLDWVRLGRDRMAPAAVSECGAGAYLAATAMAWDGDKQANIPGWADFWDVARRPGRRGLPRTARFNLEIALLADGVAAGDVYRTLRTAEGLDRAFRKLDQLKPYIIWWDQPAQAAALLTGGRALFVAAPAATVLKAGAATHHHVGVQWDGSLAEWHSWAVPKDAPHQVGALLALVVAGDPARQAIFGEATFLGPSSTDALALLPPAARAQNPAAHQGAMLAIDEAFWADNRAKLEPRFAAWLTK